MFQPPKTISYIRIWTDIHPESCNIQSLITWLYSSAELVLGKLLPTASLECLKFVTRLKQTISDFHQCAIPRVHELVIARKSRLKNRQFLRVLVTIKVREANNPSHYTRLNLACRINTGCTVIDQNYMLRFDIQLSDATLWHIHIVLTTYYVQHLHATEYL